MRTERYGTIVKEKLNLVLKCENKGNKAQVLDPARLGEC